jgi:hypothetical protein
MLARAKFTLSQVKATTYQYGGDIVAGDPAKTCAPSKALVFTAVYDDGTPENARFAKATPSGQLEMVVDNEDVLKQLVIGKSYYLDFTPAE